MHEIKCVVSAPIVRYLEDLYGQEKGDRIVAETKMNSHYLKDPNNWISFAYYHRLLAQLVAVTRDPKAAYTAAWKHTNQITYRGVAHFLTHLGSPGYVYQLAVKFSRLWSRVSRWEMQKLTKTTAVMVLHYDTYQPDHNNCLALAGSFAAVPREFGLPSATVTEPTCACHGGTTCVFNVTWTNHPTSRRSLYGTATGMAAGLAASLALTGGISPPILLLALIFGYFSGRNTDYRLRLKAAYRHNEEQATSLAETLRTTEDLNETLQEKIEERTAALKQALEELRESQDKALMAERQAAVGLLASGMAHEMNNPLNALRLSLQALAEDLTYNDEAQPLLDNANRATSRCRRIVNELLSFSREPRKLRPIDIQDILAASVAQFKRENPETITLIVNVSENLPLVQLDHAQIQQAIHNLLTNAADAMEGTGSIQVDLHGDGNTLVLSVADTGSGMNANTRKQIFDPFFTTKQGGRGMGLGLSITYQLVRRNGGHIDVESRQGTGTTFTIRFPRKSDAPPEAP